MRPAALTSTMHPADATAADALWCLGAHRRAREWLGLAVGGVHQVIPVAPRFFAVFLATFPNRPTIRPTFRSFSRAVFVSCWNSAPITAGVLPSNGGVYRMAAYIADLYNSPLPLGTFEFKIVHGATTGDPSRRCRRAEVNWPTG